MESRLVDMTCRKSSLEYSTVSLRTLLPTLLTALRTRQARHTCQRRIAYSELGPPRMSNCPSKALLTCATVLSAALVATSLGTY